MSISLNNHESRITALENKSGISLTSGSGWVDFSNGLQMRFGTINRSSGNISFMKSFTQTGVTIVGSTYYNRRLSDNDFTVTSFNKTGFGYALNASCNLGYYIAIGYLISNSIRSLLGGGLRWL